MGSKMCQDIRFLIYSYLELEELLTILDGDEKISQIVKLYYKISVNKNKYIRSGDYYTIKYMVENGTRFTQKSMELAVNYNHFRIIKYLQRIGIVLTPRMIDIAVTFGRLEIVKYFYNSQSKCKRSNKLKFEKYHTNLAVDNSHLDVLLFLYSIGLVPYSKAIKSATRNGNLEMVKFLISIGQKMTLDILQEAIYPHTIHIIYYIKDIKYFPINKMQSFLSKYTHIQVIS